MPRLTMLPRALLRVAPALAVGVLLAAALALGVVPFIFRLYDSGTPTANDPRAVSILSLIANVALFAILLVADRARRRGDDR
jgi:uncharacterized membrane protein